MSTARTLTVAAIIVAAIFLLITIAEAIFFVPAVARSAEIISNTTRTITETGTTVTLAPIAGSEISSFVTSLLLAFYSIAIIVQAVWIVADYFLIFTRFRTREAMDSTRSPTLVLGILQLIFGGVVPGILLLVAHSKVGDSMRRRGMMP
jgi:hypothetical protein